ncbi:MAG: CDP-alcohol phosphatidyltransferase family protein [Ignavibacteriae bacterium]|nr:CDP-alcohol phosphatidyltransferase family protein [Ignavibacteria bacterium]MBI3365718.1 CDP-alcohol phosphatidyltransferase family protein [Ignavibacteriota bacterium]
MPRPGPATFFKQTLKSDAFYADELINIYLLRPIAAGIVWLLYPTRITPNQVTVAAIVLGIASACAFSLATPAMIALGGVFIMLKDITDDADGQLARAKQMYSRRGRFLDSIGDFFVDVVVFAAITFVVFQSHPGSETILLGFLGLLGVTLRVSYHVYHQASFLHLENRYTLNRIIEEITEDDRYGDPVAFRLQQIFVLIYNWQDKLMERIDRWCMGKNFDERQLPVWYGDRFALRLSGLLGFGTELTLLAVCSWLNALYDYLFFNLILMNGIWASSILYRRFVLRANVK